MLYLDKVTLLCVENRAPNLALFAIKESTKNIKFKKIVLVTDLEEKIDVTDEICLFQAPTIKSTKDYSEFLLSDISHLIEGSHVLIIQWDSLIINPDLWDEAFLNFDYIGAPWPHHPNTPVGNGGFSLRSVKLIKALQNVDIVKCHPEDQAICINNKEILENKYGIRFAPINTANKFAIERGSWRNSFGFHGMFNFAQSLNNKFLERYINEIPNEFLGGVDTYELIADLLERKNIILADTLLKRTTPKKARKYRLHRQHLSLWLKIFLTKLISPSSR
jgi:hypothetical protein